MEASFSSNKPYMLRAVHEWIIDNDATPYLLVDASQASVCVPAQHIQNGQIILNVEPSAIQNWFTDNDAISFSARFSGKAMNIFIPMTALLAIYAQENGLGMAFPPDEEINAKGENGGLSLQVSEEVKDNTTELKTQEGQSKENDLSVNNSNEVVSLKTKKTSHLKVVK